MSTAPSYPTDAILLGYYCTGEKRWYKVVKETACKVTAVRLRHTAAGDPSDQEYPEVNGKRPVVSMTKRDGHLVWQGMKFELWAGNAIKAV